MAHMVSVNVTSSGNARELIDKISSNIKLEGKSGKVTDKQTLSEVGAEFVAILNENLTAAYTSSPSSGGANKASTSFRVNAASVTPFMQGSQAAYIEYGTGIVGEENPYPGEMMPGYAPQPYGHNRDEYWFMPEAIGGDDRMSHGWAGYAPLYNTTQLYKFGRIGRRAVITFLNNKARKILGRKRR